MTSSQAVDTLARRVFLGGIVAQVGIVVTGGAVRLTGSGLGCPTWPECVPGSYAPHRPESYHEYVEFGNRTLTFAVGAAVLACLVVALRHRPLRPVLVILPLALGVGVAGQAVLGGVTVLTDLHPAPVAGHFLLSMVLVGLAVALYERGREGDGPADPVVRAEIRWLGWALGLVAAAVITMGTVVTGSGPHAGDESARRFGFDPQTVSWIHADLAVLFVALVLAMLLALRLTGAPTRARRRAQVLLGVTVGQGLIGYTQYLTDLPIVLVGLHMLGASLLWLATVRLLFAFRTRPDLDRGPISTPTPRTPSRSGVPSSEPIG